MGRSVALVMLLAAVGCKAKAEARAEEPPRAATATAAPAAAPPPTPISVVTSKATMREAFDYAKTFMIDRPNMYSDGAILFAAWGMSKMKWSDVYVVKDETSFALIKKDVATERGKRMCVSGSLIQISADKSPLGTGYQGILATDAMNLAHYYAIGSSGTLVENSPARLCGVVTGLFDYSNSAGGASHAVEIVGMFDLPANKK